MRRFDAPPQLMAAMDQIWQDGAQLLVQAVSLSRVLNRVDLLLEHDLLRGMLEALAGKPATFLGLVPGGHSTGDTVRRFEPSPRQPTPWSKQHGTVLQILRKRRGDPIWRRLKGLARHRDTETKG
ncbi:hypothetical protein ACWGS9_34110 [Bradyrhizobium sp. Arg314]